jgi:hypothetical protein
MRQAGLSKGDSVNLEINERGNLEILPQIQYRAGGRRKLVTFEELFRDYSGTRLNVGDRGDGGRQGDT